MSDSLHDRFANVRMPQWYRISAWVVRAVGLLIVVISTWRMSREDSAASTWCAAGVLIGVLLLALPSLPKAYLEQRNRIRGLRDGSFKKFLDEEQKNR